MIYIYMYILTTCQLSFLMLFFSLLFSLYFHDWANPNVFHGKSAMADDSDVLPSGLVHPVFPEIRDHVEITGISQVICSRILFWEADHLFQLPKSTENRYKIFQDQFVSSIFYQKTSKQLKWSNGQFPKHLKTYISFWFLCWFSISMGCLVKGKPKSSEMTLAKATREKQLHLCHFHIRLPKGKSTNP